MTSAWVAASAAVAGAMPLPAAAVPPPVPAVQAAPADTLPPAEPACGVLRTTGEARCFATFAEELRWIGFTDVPDGYGIEQYFGPARGAAGPTLAAAVASGGGRSLTPGYAYGALHTEGGASWVQWGPTSECATTHASLQGAPAVNNAATAVVTGLCGTMKLFDSWSGASCNTSTFLDTVTGGWNELTALGSGSRNRTSCVVFGA